MLLATANVPVNVEFPATANVPAVATLPAESTETLALAGTAPWACPNATALFPKDATPLAMTLPLTSSAKLPLEKLALPSAFKMDFWLLASPIWSEFLK